MLTPSHHSTTMVRCIHEDYPAALPLADLQPQHLLVGIDSDYCAFDSMDHTRSASAATSQDLQAVSTCPEAAEFVNLYGKRGINHGPV
jgi:hypothetical protein